QIEATRAASPVQGICWRGLRKRTTTQGQKARGRSGDVLEARKGRETLAEDLRVAVREVLPRIPHRAEYPGPAADNRSRSSATAGTRDCARASHRACDSRQRRRSTGVAEYPAKRTCAPGARFDR